MKKVLFIAYEFPPLKVGGIYRPLGFLKYLKEFGYEPIIITLSKEAKKKYNPNNFEENLGQEILNEHVIVEIDSNLKHSNKKNKLQNFIDIYFHPNAIEAREWKYEFQKKISSIINEYKPALVFVTAPPFSIVDLAIQTSKQFKLPLVIDLRDAWSNWFTHPYASYFHYLYKRKTEATALKNADAVIATSKQTIEDFIKLNPTISKNKFHYIPNGFNGNLQTWENNLGKSAEIKIGYVGSFYYSPESRSAFFTPWYKKKFHRKLQYVPNMQDWMYRSPYFFFKTLYQFFKLYPQLKNKIKVEFAGEKPDWLIQMINEFDLQQNVTLLGYINHQQSLSFQRECDLLLITSAKVINGKDYSIAGKTFEYFQNQKPILAFVCDGAQKEILEESGMAIICNPDDMENSVEVLKNTFEGKINLQPNIDFIKKHFRKELTKKLSLVFDSVISK